MLYILLGFFFDVTKRYSILFGGEGKSQEGTDEGDRRGDRGPSIQQHYGWLYILRGLDTRKLLDITGAKTVMDLNINFLFSWMSMEMEINKEEERRQRMIEASQRARR